MTREELFEQNQKLVPHIICHELRLNEKEFDYEDLMQEGYLALWESTKAFDESKGQTFATFACECIRNHVFSVLRKAERKKHKRFYYDKTTALDRPLDNDTTVGDLTPDPNRSYDKALWIALTNIADNGLSSKLLWGHLYYGYSIKELSEKYHLTYGTVANRITQERKRIRNAIMRGE